MIKVYRDLEHLPLFTNAVITIGTFDGVHLGHQQIIAQLKAEAAKVAGETVIITFHPHPRKVVAGKSPVHILNTLEEKITLLDQMEIEHVVVIPFTEAFAKQSAEEYIRDFLVRKFKPHTIIIGYDHRFGRGRTGDYQLLEQLGPSLNYRVKEIPEHVLSEVIISSTKVREALLSSNIASANSLLGYSYFFNGTVVKGNQLGRKIGYPTANIRVKDEEKLIPGNGVYAVTAAVGELQDGSPETFCNLRGMMNIGLRPTVDGTTRTIEVNLFDFTEDIYEQEIRINVHHYLRGEQKFEGMEQLTAQLAVDREHALTVLKDLQ